MPGHPPGFAHSFVACLRSCLILLVLVAFSSPALPADLVYKYVDDNGVTFFTDNPSQIPPQYMGRAQALDAKTLQPVQQAPDESVPTPAGLSSLARPADQPPPKSEPPAPPFFASWLEKAAGIKVPVPTQFQLGVGLTTLVLVIGAVIIMRMIDNLVLKLLLKASIMLAIGGAVYAMYLSGLNERVSQTTHEQTGQTTTGKEILEGVAGKAGQVKDLLDKTALDPARQAIEKTKAATVGDVTKTVNQANQANQQLDKRLREIESTP